MSLAALRDLSEAAKAAYDEDRKDWHANFGIMRTPQLQVLHEALGEIVDSNRQDGDLIRVPAAIDALPGLGKTTIANTFARDFDRAQRARFGEFTADGNEHIPVFRIGLTANTTLRTLNRMICEFYGHPGAQRASAAQLGSHALDCVLSCQSRLGVIDDLHFINPRRRDGLDVSNHLKWLSSEFPVTFIYVGVDLQGKGHFSDGYTAVNAVKAQNARRWTRLDVQPFTLADDVGRSHWTTLLKSVETRLVLAEHRRGDLVALADYLFERTTGHIGSFTSLIVRGCRRAIVDGAERLTRAVLQDVRIDEASERARKELQAAMPASRAPARTKR